MKPMITISLTKEEAIKLTKILFDNNFDSDCDLPFENRLLADLEDLLGVRQRRRATND